MQSSSKSRADMTEGRMAWNYMKSHQFEYLQAASVGLRTYPSRPPNTAAIREIESLLSFFFPKEKWIGQERALTQGIVKVGGMWSNTEKRGFIET